MCSSSSPKATQLTQLPSQQSLSFVLGLGLVLVFSVTGIGDTFSHHSHSLYEERLEFSKKLSETKDPVCGHCIEQR